jgi:hypothetical protein
MAGGTEIGLGWIILTGVVANHGEFEAETEIGILRQQVSTRHQRDTFNDLATGVICDIQNPARLPPNDADLVGDTCQNGTELLIISSKGISLICINRLPELI